MWQWLLGLLGSSGSLTGDAMGKKGGGSTETVPQAGVQDPAAALAKTAQGGEAAQAQSLGGTLQGLIGDSFKGKDGGFGLSESLIQANQQAQANQMRQQEAQRQQALQAQLLQQQRMWF
jgi:hypothetical protein